LLETKSSSLMFYLRTGSSDIILNAAILRMYFGFLDRKFGIKSEISFFWMSELLMKVSPYQKKVFFFFCLPRYFMKLEIVFPVSCVSAILL
jgi:hypothetical protein